MARIDASAVECVHGGRVRGFEGEVQILRGIAGDEREGGRGASADGGSFRVPLDVVAHDRRHRLVEAARALEVSDTEPQWSIVQPSVRR